MKKSVSALLVVCLFVGVGSLVAQQATVTPVNLVSISAVSGDATKVVFTFDNDVTAYPASKYNIVAINKGVATTSSALVVPNTDPKVISVPLDFAYFALADSVQISVTLADNAKQVLTTPSYILDLSFLRAVKGYQDQILNAAAEYQKLGAQNDALRRQVVDLSSKSMPKQFDYKEPDFVAPTFVVLRFETDKYTTILVTDLDTNLVYRSVGFVHHVKIAPLTAGQEHHFRAIPADFVDQPQAANQQGPKNQKIAKKPDPPPQFVKNITLKTPDSVSFVPQLTLTSSSPSSITAKVNFDPTGAHPPDFRGYVKLHYRQVIDEKAGIYAQPIDVGDAILDSNGVPQGTTYSGSHEFVISVAASKRYNVTFTAYDQYGDVFNGPAPGASIATAAPPDPLGFKTPVAVTLNSDTGLTVSWTASKPITKAEITVTLADGTVIIPPIPTQKAAPSPDVTISTDLKGLATLVSQAGNGTGTKGPIITASMSDGTDSATIALSVTFVLPKSSGDQPSQKAGNLIATLAEKKNGKFDWKTFIASGLGILVKAL